MLRLTCVDRLALEPAQQVVRAAELQTLLDAEGVLAAAAAEAQRIRDSAQEAYAAQREQGYADGLAEGKLEMSMKMIDSVGTAVDYFANLERQVVELVLKALRKILGEYDDQQRVVQVVRTALGLARNQPHVTLRVCPAEAEIAQGRLAEITAAHPHIRYLEVVADARLSPSACLLETELGVIDASLEQQLAAIERSFARSFGAGEGASP
jgi:type III secretion protein L